MLKNNNAIHKIIFLKNFFLFFFSFDFDFHFTTFFFHSMTAFFAVSNLYFIFFHINGLTILYAEMSFMLYQKLIKLFLISFWNIHDFIFKIIFNIWFCSKQMLFFHFAYMYAINNNLTVSKSSSNAVIVTFFIHNSKNLFETIEQKQFFMFNVSMILAVKFSSDQTAFAIVDFLFKMMGVDFFLFLFFLSMISKSIQKRKICLSINIFR